MIALLAAVLVAAAPASANPIQAHIAEVRKAIDAGNAAYVATWQHGDAAAFAALYAKDAATINEDGSVTHGRADIQAAKAQSMTRAALVKGRIHTTDLAVDGAGDARL